MKKQVLARSVAERMFSREAATLEKLTQTETTSTHIIKHHFSELNKRWTTLQEKHDEYVIECVTDPSEITANESLINAYSAEFIRIEAKYDAFVVSSTTEKPTERLPAAATMTNTNTIKLERVRFRTFDGDIRKYPKFKSEFLQFVLPLCSTDQVTFVLKSYLCDSVRREVENIDHDLTAMWKRLDDKYGTVQKQIDCIMHDFKNMPTCVDNASTLHMIHLVETAARDLKCINASSQLENEQMISAIERCMPERMLSNWAERIALHSTQYSGEEKFEKLMQFLLYWRDLIEYTGAKIRCQPSACSDMPSIENCYVNHTASSLSQSAASPRKSKCLVHPSCDHPTWRCRLFRAMSASERYDVINMNSACTLCLELGHNAENCKRTFRCTICKSNHNVLIHDVASTTPPVSSGPECFD